jgi:hypothetical protein
MVFINSYAEMQSPALAADPRLKAVLTRMKIDI